MERIGLWKELVHRKDWFSHVHCHQVKCASGALSRHDILRALMSFKRLVAVLLTTAWVDLASSQKAKHRTLTIPECLGRTIAVLDLAKFAVKAGIPPCNVDGDLKVLQTAGNSCDRCSEWADVTPCVPLQVDSANGVVYSSNSSDTARENHAHGTHAGPWFLGEAIRSSSHYHSNWEDADIVFVDDYCLYTKWLADVHSFGREQPTLAGHALDLAYELLLASPRWQRHHGADFALYDAHPGFRAGAAESSVNLKICQAFVNATMLIADTPMRNVCPTFPQMSKLFVTPYAPSMQGSPNGSGWEVPKRVLLGGRTSLLYSRGQCHTRKTDNAGKSMRWYFSIHVLQNEPDVHVDCTNRELGGIHVPFRDLFTSMLHSRFCIAFPGDSASTRRLSEIMISGCVPIFPGPPYHSMPFSEYIDWPTAGIFYNITDYKPWSDEKLQFHLSQTIRSLSPNEARWWVPDANVHQYLIHLKSAHEVRQFQALCK